MIKIAFGGKMGVGKDFAADYLLKKYTGKKLTFAEPLYNILKIAQEICGFNVEKDRKFLQFVGTEWARSKNPDVWINLLSKSISHGQNLFLSDLRFANEFAFLKSTGWVCVKILRDENDIPLSRVGTGSIRHDSEQSLDIVEDNKWDYIINNKNNQEFYEKLDSIIASINHKN